GLPRVRTPATPTATISPLCTTATAMPGTSCFWMIGMSSADTSFAGPVAARTLIGVRQSMAHATAKMIFMSVAPERPAKAGAQHAADRSPPRTVPSVPRPLRRSIWIPLSRQRTKPLAHRELGQLRHAVQVELFHDRPAMGLGGLDAHVQHV